MADRKKKWPRKLTALIKAFDAHEDQDAIRLARSLVDDPHIEVRLKATQILAACLFTGEAYEEASSLWVSIFDASDDPEDWVSIITALLCAKKFDEADRFFSSRPHAVDKLLANLDDEGRSAIQTLRDSLVFRGF